MTSRARAETGPGEVGEAGSPGATQPGTSGTRKRGATKRQQALLAGVPERLTAATDRTAVAELASREAVELVGAEAAAMVVRSIEGPRVLGHHPGGGSDAHLWGNRTLAALLGSPAPVRLTLEGDPLTAGGRTALLTAPVPAGGAMVGMMLVRRAAKGFTVADQDALDRLARACGVRLHGTPAREALATVVDPATRLPGHDLMMHDLAAAVAAVDSHGMPVTLVVAEVDGLPRLRTARGAAAAEVSLAELCARIAAGLRVGDLLYRLSADEVAVLLPATDVEGGRSLGERLAALVAPAAGGEPSLSLRTVAVPVEGGTDTVMMRVARELAAARVGERWEKVV